MRKKGIAWLIFGGVLLVEAFGKILFVLSDPIERVGLEFSILLGIVIGVLSLRTGLKYLRLAKEGNKQ